MKASFSNSCMNFFPILFSIGSELLLPNLSKFGLENKAFKVDSNKSKTLLLQTVKMLYALAVDYQTYRFANRSSRCDDTVLSSIARLVKTVML